MIVEFRDEYELFSNFSKDPVGGYKQKEDGNVWMYVFHHAGVIIEVYESTLV